MTPRKYCCGAQGRTEPCVRHFGREHQAKTLFGMRGGGFGKSHGQLRQLCVDEDQAGTRGVVAEADAWRRQGFVGASGFAVKTCGN